MNDLINKLNEGNQASRLNALREIKGMIDSGEPIERNQFGDVNNHIHTKYSFSPYYPAMAVWLSYMEGLLTCGIMDHDSVGGCGEFLEAGKILNMGVTCGMECRADVSHTALNGRKINNPDQESVLYMAIHSVPKSGFEPLNRYFTPLREKRNIRNRRMVEKLNSLSEIKVDFDKDIVPLSMYDAGGSITERHLLFAYSKKVIETFGKGKGTLDFLKNQLSIQVSSKAESLLSDLDNRYYEYDLLGCLKGELVSQFYIPATDECPKADEVVRMAEGLGAIPAYAYLGDVGDSVTGDKKAQKFEDDYLEELFEVLQELGFKAVTYMPTRNSMQQLHRLKELCRKYNMLEICGEDINTPRQEFICKALREPAFHNLIDAAYALIGNEILAGQDVKQAFLSKQMCERYPDVRDRVTYFKRVGEQTLLDG